MNPIKLDMPYIYFCKLIEIHLGYTVFENLISRFMFDMKNGTGEKLHTILSIDIHISHIKIENSNYHSFLNVENGTGEKKNKNSLQWI